MSQRYISSVAFIKINLAHLQGFFYYFKHFFPTVIPHYRSMLIKLVACSEGKKCYFFIRCILAEHAESNCCFLQLVICFLQLLSLLPNIRPSKANRFWKRSLNSDVKPWSCTAVNWITEDVPVSLGLGAEPFQGLESCKSLCLWPQDPPS